MFPAFVKCYDNNPDGTPEGDFANFTRAVNDLAEVFDLGQDEIDTLYHNGGLLYRCLKLNQAPSDYWELIASGVFKECYSMRDTKDFIIKFCSYRNDTPSEIDLLRAAEEEGVSDLFIPTCFIPLKSHSLPATEVFDMGKQGLTWVIIQPTISRVCGGTDEPLDFKNYYIHPVFNGKDDIIPIHHFSDLGLNSIEWLHKIVEWHGIQMIEKFLAFCYDHRVNDLHSSNTGYIEIEGQEMPVIIDWMS